MNDQLPPQPASDPGETQLASGPGDKPARLEYLAGPGEAGDSACWAQFVCPECGGMRSEGACRCDARQADGDVALPARQRSPFPSHVSALPREPGEQESGRGHAEHGGDH
jgi:hypothetical protein